MLVCKIWWVNCDKQHWEGEETGKNWTNSIGWKCIFLETVVINYFPHSFRLCSHFSDSSCSDTKNHMFTHNSDLANLKVDCHISGKFLEQTSRALDWIGCFPNNIICWISRNYPVDSRKWYAYLFNWAYEVGEKLKKTFLTMSMNTALRDKNAKPFMLEFPD